MSVFLFRKLVMLGCFFVFFDVGVECFFLVCGGVSIRMMLVFIRVFRSLVCHIRIVGSDFRM